MRPIVNGITILFLLAPTALVLAQEPVAPVVMRAKVVDGDTILQMQLKTFELAGRFKPRDRKEAIRLDRITRNVQKVYPYARITADLLKEYEHDLSRIEREGERDLYLKLAEAELRAEFEAELKDLTMSQGKVLMKLIDRETGRTSYSLVKELRGSFQAFMWQGMAKLFGQDLKSTYDATGEDHLVEVVVQRIESGEIGVEARGPRTAKAQARLDKRKNRLYRKYGLQERTSSTN